MLVTFSIANFRSISEEQTLNLVADSRFADTHPSHAVPIPDSDEKVLRTAVLYGANAAGKSNLFKALRFMTNAVNRARGDHTGTGRVPFRFAAETAAMPSEFDLQFIANGKLYRYGIVMDSKSIRKEWLLRVEKGRETPIFERTSDDAGNSRVVIGDSGTNTKLQALAVVGGPQNQCFLGFIRSALDAAAYGEELAGILKWFYMFIPISPDQRFLKMGPLLERYPDILGFVSEFLQMTSTGIDRIELTAKEVTSEDARQIIPPRTLDELAAKEPGEPVALRVRNGQPGRWVERVGNDRYKILTLQAAHASKSGEVQYLELGDESDGTRRLFNFAPMLKMGQAVLCIDEIDRSLHPILVRQFLEIFLAADQRMRSQLIVTTHESSLLDLDLLRRDEVWFVEKDRGGASRLSSLADFEIRKSPDIRKHYLEGRFGAVPFVGNLDRLIHQTKEPERAR